MKRPSMRKAINAMCKDCTYDDLAPGTWRMQVEWCSVKICPLWPLRPVSAHYGTEKAPRQPKDENTEGLRQCVQLSGEHK